MNNFSSLYDKCKNYKLALKNETLFTYLFETLRYFSLGTPVAFITIDTRWNENNCKFLTFEIVCFHDFLQFFFHLEIFQKYLSFLCSLQYCSFVYIWLGRASEHCASHALKFGKVLPLYLLTVNLSYRQGIHISQFLFVVKHC